MTAHDWRRIDHCKFRCAQCGKLHEQWSNRRPAKNLGGGCYPGAAVAALKSMLPTSNGVGRDKLIAALEAIHDATFVTDEGDELAALQEIRRIAEETLDDRRH